MDKYEKFTKEEIIEMLERERKHKDFWRKSAKDDRDNYAELARCYDELFKNGVTTTEIFKVKDTLYHNGFICSYESETKRYKIFAPVFIKPMEETKKILLRDIMKITNNVPMDLCMYGDKESFMSVETQFLNGICLVPEAFLEMEVISIDTTETEGYKDESRLFIFLKQN